MLVEPSNEELAHKFGGVTEPSESKPFPAKTYKRVCLALIQYMRFNVFKQSDIPENTAPASPNLYLDIARFGVLNWNRDQLS